MKKIIVFIFLFLAQVITAQFALIKDKDGIVNVREKADIKGGIVGTVATNELVYLTLTDAITPNPNWEYVFYENLVNKESVVGYIHRSRLQKIDDFLKINYFKTINNTVYFRNDIEKIEVEITIQSFNSIKQINKFKIKDGFYYAYKEKQIWGTDGGLPNSCYKSVKYKKGNQKAEVPQSELENLFQPTIIANSSDFEFIKVNYDKENDVLYISSLNSDGAGGYLVLFVFEKGNYKEIKPIIPF
ncbi:hypothetical protein [Paenimyroides aestuarii]|uniref:SH3b domain-containing protein n=1 Tax=Paenimyroides aestuarii TaxID=2968490 RepID=A0ABY5NSH3_9FLAO|nr:hypothetical protein [Paenimyroides aestuarii]UUV21517.1 hypothetical protein NPX36_00210 [Paenimyroides aestuarii]